MIAFAGMRICYEFRYCSCVHVWEGGVEWELNSPAKVAVLASIRYNGDAVIISVASSQILFL